MCVWLVPRSTGVVVVGWRQFPKILLTYGRGLINAKKGAIPARRYARGKIRAGRRPGTARAGFTVS